MNEYIISDEYLFNYLGSGDESLSYAIIPYISKEEYQRDVSLLQQYSTSSNPQDKFLLIHAAKVERTDKHILGFE